MLRFNFKQGDSQIRKAKERELNKSCFYYLNRSQVQPYVLGGHCRDFSYTGALKSSSLRFTLNSYLVLLFPHRLSLLDFSICFNYKISFDNINSNTPSADLHQIKRDISRKGEGRTRQISKMELIFTILDVGKGPEFACKCHKSQQGVSFVSSHAATGNTGEKCYETLHSSKFSLGLVHLVKDLAVQYQQEKLKNKA